MAMLRRGTHGVDEHSDCTVDSHVLDFLLKRVCRTRTCCRELDFQVNAFIVCLQFAKTANAHQHGCFAIFYQRSPEYTLEFKIGYFDFDGLCMLKLLSSRRHDHSAVAFPFPGAIRPLRRKSSISPLTTWGGRPIKVLSFTPINREASKSPLPVRIVTLDLYRGTAYATPGTPRTPPISVSRKWKNRVEILYPRVPGFALMEAEGLD
jgi:hypothetical protein